MLTRLLQAGCSSLRAQAPAPDNVQPIHITYTSRANGTSAHTRRNAAHNVHSRSNVPPGFAFTYLCFDWPHTTSLIGFSPRPPLLSSTPAQICLNRAESAETFTRHVETDNGIKRARLLYSTGFNGHVQSCSSTSPTHSRA